MALDRSCSSGIRSKGFTHPGVGGGREGECDRTHALCWRGPGWQGAGRVDKALICIHSGVPVTAKQSIL